MCCRTVDRAVLCPVSRRQRGMPQGWVGRGKRSVAGAVAHKLLVSGAVEGGVLTVCLGMAQLLRHFPGMHLVTASLLIAAGEQSTKGYGVQELRHLVQLQATIFTPVSYQVRQNLLRSQQHPPSVP